jgi:hypothetical protein
VQSADPFVKIRCGWLVVSAKEDGGGCVYATGFSFFIWTFNSSPPFFLFRFLGCIVMRGWSAYVSNGLERRRVGGVGWDGVSIVFLK